MRSWGPQVHKGCKQQLKSEGLGIAFAGVTLGSREPLGSGFQGSESSLSKAQVQCILFLHFCETGFLILKHTLVEISRSPYLRSVSILCI